MINLIPPEGYRMVKREYLLRVGAVYGFLFSAVCIFVGVALVPMYVLVGAQIKDVEIEMSHMKDTNEVLKNADKEVTVVGGVLTQLKVEESEFSISAAIGEIQKNAPEGVIFKTFYIDGSKIGGLVIQVQGVSPTREKLIQLKVKLEALDLFQTVQVPISDLARDVELPFAITILPRK